jgi:hypothetical protein
MLHPSSAYRQLVTESDDGGMWLILRRPLFVALVVGSFTSITVSGHLTVSVFLDGMIFWGFIPILQGLLIAGIVVTFGHRRIPTSKAIDFFFMGHGPWLLWLLGIAGTCLFFPLKQFYLWPTEWGWALPISLLGVWAWSNVTSFAFLRIVLKLSRLGASLALLLYTVLFWGIIVSYYLATESVPLHRLRY